METIMKYEIVRRNKKNKIEVTAESDDKYEAQLYAKMCSEMDEIKY